MNRSLFTVSFLIACSPDLTEMESDRTFGEPESLVAFDASAWELPEGLAIHDDRAFVGFAPTGEIVSVSLDGNAEREHYGNLPTPPKNGFMTGLAFDDNGALFAALVSPAADPQAGIYKIPAGGGDAELFAAADEMPFPNGIVVDTSGGLLVTDSGTGSVLEVSNKGKVSTWYQSDSLVGQMDFCGPDLNTFDIGANGIAVGNDVVYVANNDLGSIEAIAINDDGSAGDVRTLVAPNCDVLGGADGLTFDGHGLLWAAVNRQNRLVTVDTETGDLEVVGEGAPLDFPASLDVGEVAGENSLVVTSFALGAALSGGDPKPALVTVAL